MNTVRLPWPPSALRPNASSPGNWRKKSEAAKKYRADCLILAKAAKLVTPESICIYLEFRPPDNRRRDLDNMLASFKQGIDAVAEAMGVDDYGFEFHITRRAACQGGCVIVHVVDSEAEESLVTISEFG